MGELVRAVQGCCTTATTYRTPFISGKDSLNNEYKVGNRSIAIPPTLLISAIGVIDDVTKTVSMDLKEPGNSIYVLGATFDELGGSHYYEVRDFVGNSVPNVRPQPKLFKSLHQAIKGRLVRACHDCSEGGIGVACAEMCFAGGIGMQISLEKVKLGEDINRNDVILFSESNTRFVVEVSKGRELEFEKTMAGSDFSKIGATTESPHLEVHGVGGKVVAKTGIDELKHAWRATLDLGAQKRSM
jgi:phosphoribosylformylglycinamidine synthase